MRRGPWISTDAGANWTEHGDTGGGKGKDSHLHADMNTAVFDGSDLTSQTLWVTSDGGVAWTDDLGKTWNSMTNRALTNLVVNRMPHMSMAVSPVQWSDGTSTEGTAIVVGAELGVLVSDLLAISAKDTGILGFQGDYLDGWAEIEGGDGRSLDFLASGELVWGVNDDAGFRVTTWNGSAFGPARSLGARPRSKSSLAQDPIISAVRDPRVINAAGEQLWAFSTEPVTKDTQALWALWSRDGHTNWRWDPVQRQAGRLQPFSPPGPYRSLSSATGRTIFLGGVGGIDRMNPTTGMSIPLTVGGVPPPWDDTLVVAIKDRRVVGIFNDGSSGYHVFSPSSRGLRMQPLTDLVAISVAAGRPKLQSVEIEPGHDRSRYGWQHKQGTAIRARSSRPVTKAAPGTN